MTEKSIKRNKNSLRIFLPKLIDESKPFLYGIKREGKSVEKTIDFYVTECRKDQTNDVNFLGQLKTNHHQIEAKKKSILLSVFGSDKPLVLVINENLENLQKCSSTVIFYYDKDKFLLAQMENYDDSSIENHFGLTLAKQLKKTTSNERAKSSSFIYQLLTIFNFLMSKVSVIFTPFFSNTVTYKHCINWKKCLMNTNHAKNGFILLDIVLGVIFLLFLTHIKESGKYFMDLTEIIVQKLRALLTMLEGSPVGLKLNEQLNSFLLNCFMYHVDLWFNFIIIIEPAIHHIFLPISLIGLAGFSFQCAVICDLFTLLTLHAHCFFIYAAMLYKLEIKGLRSLWRIVLGRRRNVLKNREESQEYTKNQLFLATLFFTVLLFLLPTVIIYYLVFASLRFVIYCLTFILKSLQTKIIEFSFFKFVRWIFGYHVDPSNCSINILSNKNDILEVELEINSSAPWSKSNYENKIDFQLSTIPSIGTFAMQLVRGDIVAF